MYSFNKAGLYLLIFFYITGMFSIINGELIHSAEAKISISDLSIQRGYAVFDFFRVENNRPLYLSYHLERLAKSAAVMRLHEIESITALRQMIDNLMAANNIPNSGIKITITGGYAEDGYSISKPNILISQTPLLVNNVMAKGLRIVTYKYQRQLPHVKTIDYLQAIYLQPHIKEQHADDVLYHSNGVVTECPRSNFFIVTKDDEIITPAKNVLAGVTRKRIMMLPGFAVREAEINLTDIENAKEAFVSSTTKIVMPVIEINGKPVNKGLPGKITRALFDQLVKAADISA